MISNSAIGLINNAALLLVTTLLYDQLVLKRRGQTQPYQLLQGLLLGGIGLAVMATPWMWQPGTVFDTRSVLLSVAGLFFGAIPTTLAMAMTATYRLLQGGVGAGTGTWVILTSGLMGLLWRRCRKNALESITAGELYLFGLAVSGAMLLWMFSLPETIAWPVLSNISLPVLLIYPLATLLMGLLMRDRLRRRQEQLALRQAQAALHDQKEIFSTIVDQADDAIGLVETETGRFVEFNTAAHNNLGYTRDEFAQMSVFDIEAELSPEEVRQNFHRMEQPAGEVVQTKHRHRGGSIRNVRVSARRVIVGGKPYLAAIWSDITQQIQTQEALSASERKYRQLHESLRDAYAAVDLDGRLREFNPAFRAMLGYADDELRQLTYVDLTPEQWHAFESRIVAEQILPRGYSEVYEKEYRRKDGTVFPVELRTFLIRNESGHPSGMWAIIRDISERKQIESERLTHSQRLEEQIKERTDDLRKTQRALVNLLEDVNLAKDELAAANVRLQELDRLKSMFIASMSHELRTPLNAIIGFSSILHNGMAGELTAEQKDMLARVGRAGRHLLALITDIIDISKIESGKMSPVATEFPLTAVLREADETIRHLAEEKGLQLTVNMPTEPVLLRSDRKRLLQCLLNLLSNAVKFTERGNILLDAEIISGDRLKISVRDTGIGIPQEQLEQLFSPFVRLDSPLKMTTPGTGLGLYLTHKLAGEILGGTVSAHSIPGEGSVFTLTVPRQMPLLEGMITAEKIRN